MEGTVTYWSAVLISVLESFLTALTKLRPDLSVEVQEVIDPLMIAAAEALQKIVEKGL